MVKFKPFFGLCPLIDQRSLLGITEDVNKQFVIVTLGKNIVTKYKLSDQKPIHSWSTKERLTSPVIYDEQEGQYLAIFNHNVIRMFGSDGDNLDRIKKQKFQTPIHTLVKLNDHPTLVLFKNGTVSALHKALQERKEASRPPVVDASDVIEHNSCIVFNNQIYVGLLLNKENGDKSFTYVPLRPDTYVEDTQNIKRIVIKRTDSKVNLTGYLLKHSNNGPEFLTLWSDRKLYSYPLYKESEMPGRFISAVESLDCSQRVSMSALSNNHIVMYGANPKEEGAVLVVYNIQVAVTQCKQSFKLYSEGVSIWTVYGNLLLAIGNHLAVIPFELDTEKFAGLIGSHKQSVARREDDDVIVVNDMETASWGGDYVNGKAAQTNIPRKLRQCFEEYYKGGLTDSLICQEILPDLLDKKDIESIMWVIDYFKEINEYLLVKLLSFCLNVDGSVFANSTELKLNQNGLVSCLQPLQRCELMNNILNLSYSDILLLPHLRVHLNFTETLTSLQYVCILLGDNDVRLPDCSAIESEKKVIEWGTLLLDSHYQEFLLSKDPKVLSLLEQFKVLIDAHIKCMNDYKIVVPLLDVVNRGKNLQKLKNPTSKCYSIEKIQLY